MTPHEKAEVTKGNIGITKIEVILGTEGVRGLKRIKGLSGFIEDEIRSVYCTYCIPTILKIKKRTKCRRFKIDDVSVIIHTA